MIKTLAEKLGVDENIVREKVASMELEAVMLEIEAVLKTKTYEQLRFILADYDRSVRIKEVPHILGMEVKELFETIPQEPKGKPGRKPKQ